MNIDELHDNEELFVHGVWSETSEVRTVYVQKLDDDLQVVSTTFFDIDMRPFDDEDL